MKPNDTDPMFHSSFEFKAEGVDEDGTFTGYGSVFNVQDSYDEIVMPGAFTSSLELHRTKGTMPKMLWQHDASEPIGVYLSMAEDERGLLVRGKLAINEDTSKDVRRAREAYELMKLNALGGLSIGYKVRKREIDEEERIVRLTEVDLWEVSPVTFPANEAARIGTVKSARDFERFLREAGFSKKEAVAVASHGFRGLEQRDADSELLSKLAEALEQLNNTLTRKG